MTETLTKKKQAVLEHHVELRENCHPVTIVRLQAMRATKTKKL